MATMIINNRSAGKAKSLSRCCQRKSISLHPVVKRLYRKGSASLLTCKTVQGININSHINCLPLNPMPPFFNLHVFEKIRVIKAFVAWSRHISPQINMKPFTVGKANGDTSW